MICSGDMKAVIRDKRRGGRSRRKIINEIKEKNYKQLFKRFMNEKPSVCAKFNLKILFNHLKSDQTPACWLTDWLLGRYGGMRHEKHEHRFIFKNLNN